MINVLIESFLIVFLAEMGDKSQLLMIAMSAEYKIRDILVGTTLSVILLNLLAVTLGTAVGDLLPETAISLIAGTAFLCFSLLRVGGEEEEETVRKRGKTAIFAVFGTYFLAELGDKTQLSALALAAGGEGWMASSVPIFFGSTAALLSADVIGLLIGTLLGKRLPRGAFGLVSAVLFFVCGAMRLLEGFSALLAESPAPILLPILFTVLPCAAVACVTLSRMTKRGIQK